MSLFRTLLSQLSRLPSEYQEVEWIKGSGTQYINLNLSGLNGILCEYDVVHDSDYKSLDSNGGYIIGSHGINYPYGRNGGWYKAGTANAWELGYGEIYPGVARTLVFGQKYHVKFCTFYDEAYIEVDGERLTTTSGQTVTDNPVYVFNNGYGINYGGPSTIAKLYSAKISKKVNGEIVLMRDLIPCYRKSDNEIGLYDLVENQFYVNNGTGKFSCYPAPEPLPKRLPDAYQEVEWIKATRSSYNSGQYINTGLKGKETTGFEIEFNTSSSLTSSDGWGSVLGIADTYSGSTATNRLEYGTWTGYYSSGYFYFGKQINDNQAVAGGITRNTILTAKLKNGVFTSPTGATTQISTSSFTSSRNIVLFARNFNYNVEGYITMKLYSCKFYDGDTLIRDYVPCYRKSDSVIGLYDLVNNQFYTNAGTGTFTKGNDV